MSESCWAIGDSVVVAPTNRDEWWPGTVTAIDEPHRPRGVRVQFDEPLYGMDHCYATHSELRPEQWAVRHG